MLFTVTPHTRCRLKLLKLERIKDYLLLEEEFIKNQERLKPQEEKHEVDICVCVCVCVCVCEGSVNREPRASEASRR